MTDMKDIVLGVSGGLLSLVGLIAIFISINSQHSIEKARDILLELELFEINNLDTSILTAKTLRKKLEQYKNLISMSTPTIIVIFIAISTIVFVGGAWFYYFNSYFVIISCFILLLFVICLLLLTKVSLIGTLPKQNVFTNINSLHKGIKMRNLFSMALQCRVYVKNRALRNVSFHSHLFVENLIGVDVSICYTNDGKLVKRTEYKEFQIREGRKIQKKPGNEINTFSPKLLMDLNDITEDAPREDYDGIMILFNFTLESGFQEVRFVIINLEDTNRLITEVLTPSSWTFYDDNFGEDLSNWEYDLSDKLTHKRTYIGKS